MKKDIIIGYIAVFFFCFSSCRPTTTLFQADSRTPPYDATTLARWQQTPTLQPGDKITVSVWEHEELSIGSQNSQYTTGEQTGRWLLIDAQGEANLPKIGRIKLSGYSVKEASFVLEREYAKQIQNPIVNIRVLNQFITVLGEVSQPGKYAVNDNSPSLEQIIGEAKGLTEYADIRKVMIYREVGNEKYTLEVDMASINALRSRIVLLPNDVVYVPPTNRKNFNKTMQDAAPVLSVVSTLALVLSLILK